MRIWQNPRTAPTLGYFLFLFLALYFVYKPTLKAPYFSTDDALLIDIPQIKDFQGITSLKSIFTPGDHVDYYPIRDLTYVLDSSLGSNPIKTARVQQIFWLILSSFFLYLIFAELKVHWLWGMLCTALWATHPLHVESIAWISARKDILAISFCLISIYFFLKSQKNPGLLCGLAFFLFSGLSKSSFVLLPLAVLPFFYFLKLGNKRQFSFLVIASILGLALAALHRWQYTSVNDMRVIIPYTLRLESSLIALGKMAAGIVWPNLNIFDPENFGEWATLNRNFMGLGFALWITAFVLVAKSFLYKNHHQLFWIAVLASLYFPISGLFFPHSSFYSARYIEPSFLAIIFGIAYFFQPSRKVLIATCVLPLLFIWQAKGEAKIWSIPAGPEAKAYLLQPTSLSIQAFYWGALSHLPGAAPERAFLNEMLTNNCDRDLPSNLEINSPFVNCRSYYRYRSNMARWNGKMDESQKYWEKFRAAQEPFFPKPKAIARMQLESMLSRDDIDLAFYQYWLNENQYFPTPEYRFLRVVGECLLNQNQSRALAEYRKANLLPQKWIEPYFKDLLGEKTKIQVSPCLQP